MLSEFRECCESSRNVVSIPDVRIVQAHGELHVDVKELKMYVFMEWSELTECCQTFWRVLRCGSHESSDDINT